MDDNKINLLTAIIQLAGAIISLEAVREAGKQHRSNKKRRKK